MLSTYTAIINGWLDLKYFNKWKIDTEIIFYQGMDISYIPTSE